MKVWYDMDSYEKIFTDKDLINIWTRNVVKLMLQGAVSDLCTVGARSEACFKVFVFQLVNSVIVIT